MKNEDKELYQIRGFKVACLAPIIFSALIVLYIVLTNSLEPMAGYEGINNAVDVFRIPISILALIFPAIALVATNHRSLQSKKQIENAQKQISAMEKQNDFANHYKHLEEFIKYIGGRYSHLDARSIHENVYCEIEQFDINLNKTAFSSVQNGTREIYKSLVKFNSNPNLNTLETLGNIFGHLRHIENLFKLPQPPSIMLIKVQHDGGELDIPTSYLHVFEYIQHQMKIVKYIGLYSRKKRMRFAAFQALLNMNYENAYNGPIDFTNNIDFGVTESLGVTIDDCGENGETIVIVGYPYVKGTELIDSSYSQT